MDFARTVISSRHQASFSPYIFVGVQVPRYEQAQGNYFRSKILSGILVWRAFCHNNNNNSNKHNNNNNNSAILRFGFRV